MNVIGNPPQWALDLMKEVCKDYHRTVPSVFRWEQGTHKSSSGWTRSRLGYYYRTVSNSSSGTKVKRYKSNGEIKVRAGTDETDQRLVLLHEIAHHIVAKTKKGRHTGHSLKFWQTAFELYQAYGVDLETAINRERNYKVKANWVIASLNN